MYVNWFVANWQHYTTPPIFFGLEKKWIQNGYVGAIWSSDFGDGTGAFKTTQSRFQSFDRISCCTGDRIALAARTHLDWCTDDFGLCFCPSNVARNAIPIWLSMEILLMCWNKNISPLWFASSQGNLARAQFQTWKMQKKKKETDDTMAFFWKKNHKFQMIWTHAGSTIKRSPLTNKNCDKLKYWSHRSK